MYNRVPELLFGDIFEAINKIKNYTSNYLYNNFINDSKTCDAVIRNFEIIGEASNRLTDEFKENYPQINWFRIRGFRNRIVHDYMGIDYSIVWSIIQNDINNLLIEISNIIISK